MPLLTPTTEALDRLYLEWSQFTRARTSREIELVKALEAMQEAYYDFHDAHSMTEPVTGRAGNANALAIEALAKARG